MKNRQQLNYLQHQYICSIYCKLLCLKYLQNLSSVISILSSEPYAYSNAVARDGRVDVISRTDPEGRIKTIAYSSSGRASGITNALGHTTTYRFDYIKSRKEFYLKTSYPGGRVTETWYERDGEVKRRDINGINIITITEDLRKDIEKDTFGRTTTKAFDEFKNLLKTTYPDGTSTSTTYDLSTSNPLTNTDERGTITKYEYWPNGRLKKMTEALGTSVERSTEYTYDQYGQMLTKTQVGDAVTATAITQYFYDTKGNVSKIIDAEGNEVNYISYNSRGKKLSKLDGKGNNWTYSYNEHGQLLKSINPLLEETVHEYSKLGLKTKTTYPNMTFIKYEYDVLRRLVKKTDELGFFKMVKYNLAGNVVESVDELGRVTQYNTDLLNRITEIEDMSENITKYNYPVVLDNSLAPASLLDYIGIEYPTYNLSRKFDLRNRVVERNKNYLSDNQTRSNIVRFKYDNVGNLLEKTDEENRITKIEYDVLNRKIKIIDSLLNEINFNYDNRNNLISKTIGLNQTYTYSYDKLNRLVSESLPMGQTAIINYDSNSNILTKIDPIGQKLEHAYDNANKLTKLEYYNENSILVKTIVYTYDNRGNLLTYNDGTTQGTYTYDNKNQKLTETIVYGQELFDSNYTYHPDGQKASYTGIDATTYSFYYNNLGILQNIVIPNEGNISSQNFQWNRPQTINYPGGITRTLAYDGLQRINSIHVKDSNNQTLMDYSYTYTPVGNITNKNTEHGNYTYGYDNLNRLTSAEYPTLTDETFTYDAIGNRKSDSNTGVTEWLYNQNNELLNSVSNQYIYNANGNLVEKKNSEGQLENLYIYSADHRLKEIKDNNSQTLSSYYYDPFGRRLSKTIINSDFSTTITYFHYNSDGLSAEKTGTEIKSYLFAPQETWSVSPILKRENNTYYYYQNDHLGTPNILHDKQGQVVNAREMKAFGEWTNSVNSIDNSFAFAGQYLDDETGYYYNLNRDYDPKIGRYIESDPIGLRGGDNVYLYTNNSPLISMDYNGLQSYETFDYGNPNYRCGCYENCLTKMNPSFWTKPVCIFVTGSGWWFGGWFGAIAGYWVCNTLEDANIMFKCDARCYEHCNGDAPCPPEFEEPNMFVD